MTSRWELAIDKEEELVTGTPELCSTSLPNIRKIKNITSKHLPSLQKLAKGKEKVQVTGTSEPCCTPFLSEYPEKAKGCHEKTLVIAMKLATGMEKVRVTGTSELLCNPLANIRRLKNVKRKH